MIDLIVKIGQLFLQLLELLIIFFITYLFIERYISKTRYLLQREGILQHGYGTACILQRYPDALYKKLRHLKFSPFAVFGINEIPGCYKLVCSLQILVIDLYALVIVLILPLIPLLHSPGCGLTVLKLLQTFFLFAL